MKSLLKLLSSTPTNNFYTFFILEIPRDHRQLHTRANIQGMNEARILVQVVEGSLQDTRFHRETQLPHIIPHEVITQSGATRRLQGVGLTLRGDHYQLIGREQSVPGLHNVEWILGLNNSSPIIGGIHQLPLVFAICLKGDPIVGVSTFTSSVPTNISKGPAAIPADHVQPALEDDGLLH